MSYPGYPPYPSTQSQPGAYPGTTPYPSGGAGFQPQPGGYPPQQPGYPPQSGYPSQPGYPTPQPGAYPPSPGYPPQPGYPSQQAYPQPGYPAAASQPGYPTATSQPGYPPVSQPAYPAASATSYPSQPGIPASSAYPAQPTMTSAYPSAAPAYPSAGYPSPGAYPTSGYPSMSSPSIAAMTGQPTLRAFHPFDARQDAEHLRKAMKGFGTDEATLINILTKRSCPQRQEIVLQYKSLYGKDLADNMKSELSGKLEDLMIALVLPRFDYYAKEIHHALSFSGYRPESVTEILCTASNEEIRQIRSAYERAYKKSLEHKIKDDLSGDYKRLLISMCQANRDESPHVDIAGAQRDAQALYSAGELQWGTDESVFNMILTNRSYSHLAQVFGEYQKVTGRDFESAVRNEFSGDIKDGLLAIVKTVRNKHEYFAEQLMESLRGAGTNDRTLIRIVVSRCEIDMVEVKRAFQAKYGTTLESSIQGDTSGDYRKALLSLVS